MADKPKAKLKRSLNDIIFSHLRVRRCILDKRQHDTLYILKHVEEMDSPDFETLSEMLLRHKMFKLLADAERTHAVVNITANNNVTT